MTPTARRLLETMRDSLIAEQKSAANQVEESTRALNLWREKHDTISLQLTEIRVDLATKD